MKRTKIWFALCFGSFRLPFPRGLYCDVYQIGPFILVIEEIQEK